MIDSDDTEESASSSRAEVDVRGAVCAGTPRAFR
jgi:hypothetical protein